MPNRREFISVLSMAAMVKFRKVNSSINMAKIDSYYFNTKDVIVPVPKDEFGDIIPVKDRHGADKKVFIPIPIPNDIIGLVGWHLGISCKNRNSLWLATVTLATNSLITTTNGEEEFGIDHHKARERDPGQGPNVILPENTIIEATDLSLKFKAFNEDMEDVVLRGNCWVYFIKG